MPLGTYTCDLQKRPFVSLDDATRSNAFPIPLALIDRIIDGPGSSALALKLFYGLLFVAWNVLDSFGTFRPFAYDVRSLRHAIGKRFSSAELCSALLALSECHFELPDPDDPSELVKAPLLDWYHIERDRRVFWSFSEPVHKWCGRTGSTYAWLDLTVAFSLNGVAALRLYEIGAMLMLRKHKKVRLSHEQLRRQLQVVDGTYNLPSDFKGKLLGRALEDVNARASFTMRHEPYSPVAHRFADAGILSVALTQCGPASAETELQPIRRDDLAFVPLPPAQIYEDFLARPSAPKLPAIDQASINALLTDAEDSSLPQ